MMKKTVIFILFHLLFSIPYAYGKAEFSIYPLNKLQVQKMKDTCFDESFSPIPIKRLKSVKFKHYDFEGNIKKGEIIVLDVCAQRVLKIFKEIFSIKFPIEKCKPIYYYKGDDSLSMDDNNSSAHNCRKIIGKKKKSLHSYGTAIDINPRQNPFVVIKDNCATYLPKDGINYANRKKHRFGKPVRQGMAEDIEYIFSKNGFYFWGGNWDNPIDYHHFQLSRTLSELLTVMPFKEGEEFFEECISYYNEKGSALEMALENFINDLKKYPEKKTLKNIYLLDKKEFYNYLKIFYKSQNRDYKLY